MPICSQENLDATVGRSFDARQRTALRQLVTEEVIAEHRADPLGQHSDGLRRLLNYFGSFPIDGKLIVEYDGGSEWFASRLTGGPPLRAQRVGGPFNSELSAIDAVFRLRLRDVFGIELSDV
jgi:hypothetical protein